MRTRRSAGARAARVPEHHEGMLAAREEHAKNMVDQANQEFRQLFGGEATARPVAESDDDGLDEAGFPPEETPFEYASEEETRSPDFGLHEVLHQMVAIRKAPAPEARALGAACKGEVLKLFEWDAASRFRATFFSLRGGHGNTVKAWVMMRHPDLGALFRPTGPDPHCAEMPSHLCVNPHCLQELPEVAQFCHKCGTKREALPYQTAAPPLQPAREGGSPPRPAGPPPAGVGGRGEATAGGGSAAPGGQGGVLKGSSAQPSSGVGKEQARTDQMEQGGVVDELAVLKGRFPRLEGEDSNTEEEDSNTEEKEKATAGGGNAAPGGQGGVLEGPSAQPSSGAGFSKEQARTDQMEQEGVVDELAVLKGRLLRREGEDTNMGGRGFQHGGAEGQETLGTAGGRPRAGRPAGAAGSQL